MQLRLFVPTEEVARHRNLQQVIPNSPGIDVVPYSNFLKRMAKFATMQLQTGESHPE